MTDARITEIRVEGLRTLADVTLKLDGLTVLIGENGSGKSSLIEACELLRRAGGPEFLSELYNPHGGMFALLRDGARSLRFTITLAEGPAQTMEYGFRLVPSGAGAAVVEEHLHLHRRHGPFKVLDRSANRVNFVTIDGSGGLDMRSPGQLALQAVPAATEGHPAIDLVREALQRIDVHLPFETLPSWAARAFSRKSEIRSSVLLAPAERLDTLGTNLANVYYALREQSDRAYWDDTMDLLRLGLGPDFEEVRSAVDLGGGAHALAIKWRGRDRLMPAAALSDGQIAFLGFVGLYRLKRDRSLLAIDEPELHLHPGLLARVTQILESMGEVHPVLVTTHSDRLLDALSSPASSVAVCELEAGATRIRRLDPAALESWLTDYRGLGSLRSEGHLADVLAEEP